ncbi:MAG: Uma2 family endonuclease [Acidobacteriota bacterium]|nr:Uma2 family endonuclease [Acidobacteriota bacterium]
MGLAKLKTKLDIEEYFEGELLSETRHEFIYGEVFAMAGASDSHGVIVGNIFGNIWTHLKNSRCQPFAENMKLKADAQTFYYPDVIVACDEPPKSAYYREEPVLLVEVLSPTTERTDRKEKLAVYKNIASLREYLIVSQEKISVEVHRKLADETWQTEIYDETDAEIMLDSIDFNLPLDEIYRRVNFPNSSDEVLQ